MEKLMLHQYEQFKMLKIKRILFVMIMGRKNFSLSLRNW